MSVRALLSALLLSALFPAWAEVVSVDVYEWARTGTGVTPSGWTVTNIDEYVSEKGVRLDTKDDAALSPVFTGVVTQIVLNIKASSTTVTRFLTVAPVVAKAGARELTAAADDKYVDQSLVWRLEDGVRQFRLQNSTGSGNAGWGIRSLRVHLDRVESPQGLREIVGYSDALSVGWKPESRAVSYEADAARIVTVLPKFDLLERWNFSVLTNDTGNPLPFENVPGAESLKGVSGEYLNVQARSGGYLQAGNTKGAGKIRIDLASSGLRTAILRLYRSQADGTDGRVDVSVVRTDGVTNRVCEPFLTTRPSDFLAELPGDARELLIETSVKSRRIRIEDVKIVTGFVPGSVTTNAMPAVRTSRCETVLKGLSPGDWLWRVKSLGREGCESLWTDYREATLGADSPPFEHPGILIMLR